MTFRTPLATDPPAMPALGQALWAEALVRLRRGLVFMLVLTLGIALLLTVMDHGRGFGPKWVYSACIGFSCWLLIDGTRVAGSAALAVYRHRQGLPRAPEPMAIRWLTFLPVAVVGMVAGPLIGQSLADRLLGTPAPPLWAWGSPTTRLTLFITLLATAISVTVIWLQERVAGARAQAEAAQRAHAESQLRLLQSQLEPHMLFNTLANLRVLISLDAERAQRMLDHLIAYLRATLQASRRPWHPLRDEFARLADYLALMQVRMGPRLKTLLTLPEACAEIPVPPLLLQPLVENSILHGLEPKVGGGELVVTAALVGRELRLTVVDTGVGLSPSAGSSAAGGTGFGLEQVRSRLGTLYAERATLTVEALPEGPGVVACITLPLDSAT